MKPGRYRAITETTLELCRSNGTSNPSVLAYTTYPPGAEFEIPVMVNGHYCRVQEDPDHETPPGPCEWIGK